MNDKELIAYCKDFRRGLLGRRGSRGMCFVVVSPLSTLLAMCGVANKVLNVDFRTPTMFCNHVMMLLEDGRILDPTADQFKESGLPAIYLGPIPNCYVDWVNDSGVDAEGNHEFIELHAEQA